MGLPAGLIVDELRVGTVVTGLPFGLVVDGLRCSGHRAAGRWSGHRTPCRLVVDRLCVGAVVIFLLGPSSMGVVTGLLVGLVV
jgi:hypothetical protein